MRRLMTVAALAVAAALLPLPPAGGAPPLGVCPRNAGPLTALHPADRNGNGEVCVVSLPSGETVAVVDDNAMPNGVPPKMRH